MLFKILLWGIVGYIVYSWFQDKFLLKKGESDNKTTIHHHHYKEEKKRGKGDDEDYIEFEEMK